MEDAEVKTESSLSSVDIMSTTKMPALNGKKSLVMMRMSGNKAVPCHIRKRIKEAKQSSQIKDTTLHLSHPDDDQTSMQKEESANQSCCTGSESVADIGDGHMRKTSKIGRQRHKPFLSQTASQWPSSAVKTMRISMASIGSLGDAYAYGGGLPDEKASYLEVTSNI